MSARDAYPLWASTYDGETPVSVLEEAAVRALTPSLGGKSVLDAACGNARRIRSIGEQVARAVGVDLVFEMLTAPHAGGALRERAVHLVNADVRALPFAPRSFDVIWCRLALGHLPDLADAYAELARVGVPGATLIVTDFHPAAARAGHTRSFRDPLGARREIEHHIYELGDHEVAAARAGLRLDRSLEPGVGPAIKSFYDAPAVLKAYEAQLGLPLVAAMQFTL